MKVLPLLLAILTACASKPPDPDRKIVVAVEIQRIAAFLTEGATSSSNFNETLPLSLKQQNFIGFELEERALAKEGGSVKKREPFIIVPEPAPRHAIRFFLYKGQESLGAIHLQEKTGASAQTSAGFYTVRLTIKGIESP